MSMVGTQVSAGQAALATPEHCARRDERESGQATLTSYVFLSTDGTCAWIDFSAVPHLGEKDRIERGGVRTVVTSPRHQEKQGLMMKNGARRFFFKEALLF